MLPKKKGSSFNISMDQPKKYHPKRADLLDRLMEQWIKLFDPFDHIYGSNLDQYPINWQARWTACDYYDYSRRCNLTIVWFNWTRNFNCGFFVGVRYFLVGIFSLPFDLSVLLLKNPYEDHFAYKRKQYLVLTSKQYWNLKGLTVLPSRFTDVITSLLLT